MPRLAMFVERYTIGALPPAMLGLGWALLGVRPRAAAWCAVIASAALSAIPLAGYYGGVDKDPWRETAAMLRARVAPGDVVLVECRNGPQVQLHYFESPPGVVV